MSDDPITVLLVDDEPDVAATTREFLEHEAPRLEVETVGTATQGLERLEAGGVDCIVSDFEMPGRDGIQFLEAVRSRGYDLPFLLFTGRGSEEVAADAISAGATDYLQKSPGNEQYTMLANRLEQAVERRRADAAAAAANERLATVYERVTDGVVAMDSSFRYTYANTEAQRLLGHDASELIGEVAWEVFPQLDDTEFGPALRRALTEQEPATVEDYWPPIDTWFLVRVYPAEDGLSVYFRDISDRKRRERELENERERYRQLVDSAPVGIVGYDAGGEIVYANDAAAETAGVGAPSALVGEPAIGFLTGEDRERAADRIRSIIEDREVLPPTEYRVDARDGAVRHVTVSAAPMTYDGEPAGQVVVNDVTELTERERLLSELHAATADIAACETAEAVYERVVAASERVLAFDLAIADAVEGDELVPRAISADVDDEGYFETIPLEKEGNLAARAARAGEPTLIEDLQATDVVPASTDYRSALTVPIGDHGVFQAVAEAPGAFEERDLEHVELLVAHAEETLTRLDREAEIEARTTEIEGQHDRLEGFASMVSHDLRNPLNVAAGRLELARERYGDDGDLAAADRALDRSFALIEELLAVASGERPPMELEPISLAEAAERSWQPVTEAEGRLRADTDRVIEADEARLHHLLENLFANALEHGGDGVTVTVGAVDGGFCVEDDGVGVPEGDLERMFERSYSTGQSGTGLGLSLVQQVAEAHGWSLEATESEAGGFRVEFTDVSTVDG
ncbi:MAG: PAS domain S-box protein [Halobacteriales archaeon]|nr:PAS domain S-box protein [Halobacteriales archaeon]